MEEIFIKCFLQKPAPFFTENLRKALMQMTLIANDQNTLHVKEQEKLIQIFGLVCCLPLFKMGHLFYLRNQSR